MSVKDLFRMTEGGNVWTFTSSNEAQTYQSPSAVAPEDYLPRVVGRSEIKDTSQFLKDTVDLVMPLMDSIGQHFLQSPIDYVAKLDIYTKDEAGVYTTEWRGTLKDVKPDDKQIKLVFNSVFSANRTVGARPVFQRNCRHTVYSPQCGVAFDDFKLAANVTGLSSDGLTLTVAEAATKPNGYFNAGVIVMPDGTMRYIRQHVGSSLTLIRFSPSLVQAWNDAPLPKSVPVFIAPGCSQAMETCIAVFENWLNYGGFRNIPLKNPNSSSIV